MWAQIVGKGLKPSFLTTFGPFLNDPDFSWEIWLRQFLPTIGHELQAKNLKKGWSRFSVFLAIFE